MNIFLPVFKREFKSGLYSVHTYYFGNWFAKLFCLSFYPVLIITLLFYPLGLTDSSTENLIEFIKVGCLIALNGTTIGHMWSSIFDHDMNAIVSGFGVLSACICGSGAIGNKRNNPLVATLMYISPQSYSLELIIRRVLHNNTSGQNLVLSSLELNNGEEICWKAQLI